MNDLISRQAVLEKIHWLGLDNDTAIKCDLAIRALPPVNPQEPKSDVLDKIRAEIAVEAKGTMNDRRAEGLYKALQIIDKYTAEVEPQEVECLRRICKE